jgi:hypothetical protein
MDKELEEKLERDNLTLKAHIQKLQDTIKQIKSEINHDEKATKSSFSSKTIQKNNKNVTSNLSSSNNLKREESPPSMTESRNTNHELNNLKFSFNNIQKEKTDHNNNISHENLNPKIKQSPNNKKKNFYQENTEKLRKEKEMIEKMQTVKKKANIQKTYSEEEADFDEINKFHNNQNIYNTINNNKSNISSSIYSNNINIRQSDEEGSSIVFNNSKNKNKIFRLF